jgi:hypothetical protein
MAPSGRRQSQWAVLAKAILSNAHHESEMPTSNKSFKASELPVSGGHW